MARASASSPSGTGVLPHLWRRTEDWTSADGPLPGKRASGREGRWRHTARGARRGVARLVGTERSHSPAQTIYLVLRPLLRPGTGPTQPGGRGWTESRRREEPAREPTGPPAAPTATRLWRRGAPRGGNRGVALCCEDLGTPRVRGRGVLPQGDGPAIDGPRPAGLGGEQRRPGPGRSARQDEPTSPALRSTVGVAENPAPTRATASAVGLPWPRWESRGSPESGSKSPAPHPASPREHLIAPGGHRSARDAPRRSLPGAIRAGSSRGGHSLSHPPGRARTRIPGPGGSACGPMLTFLGPG